MAHSLTLTQSEPLACPEEEMHLVSLESLESSVSISRAQGVLCMAYANESECVHERTNSASAHLGSALETSQAVSYWCAHPDFTAGGSI